MDIPAHLYESVLEEIVALQDKFEGIMVQARCAPHFKRILYEHDKASPFTRATGYDGGGCIAATHYCRINPHGEVTPCPYIELSGGNIRDQKFWDIWDNSPLFESFRVPSLQGKCSMCEYKQLCGGCRARALAEQGDLMAADPSCAYAPRGSEEIPVFSEEPTGDGPVRWTAAAEKRLERIPMFLRARIKRRLEEVAAETCVSEITTEMMIKFKRQREQELGISFKS